MPEHESRPVDPESIEEPDNEPSLEQIMAERRAGLARAVERIKLEIEPEQLAGYRAIILFGSMARGEARADSDVDLFFVLDNNVTYNAEVLKSIVDIFEHELPGVGYSINYQTINHPSRPARLITSAKGESQASWEYLYVRDEDSRTDIESVLQDELSKKK